jgi:hypothetical protein
LKEDEVLLKAIEVATLTIFVPIFADKSVKNPIRNKITAARKSPSQSSLSLSHFPAPRSGIPVF